MYLDFSCIYASQQGAALTRTYHRCQICVSVCPVYQYTHETSISRAAETTQVTGTRPFRYPVNLAHPDLLTNASHPSFKHKVRVIVRANTDHNRPLCKLSA